MPSGETVEVFNNKILAAWNLAPQYIDKSDYDKKLLWISEKQNCYGFNTPDVIPASPKILSWKNADIIGTLYPLRHTNFSPLFTPYSPKPSLFSKINIDVNIYAQNDYNFTSTWLYLSELNQYFGSVQAQTLFRDKLKNFLVKMAEYNAFSDGLYVNWSKTITENTPVHYELLPFSINLIHSFNFTQNSMTQNEK